MNITICDHCGSVSAFPWAQLCKEGQEFIAIKLGYNYQIVDDMCLCEDCRIKWNRQKLIFQHIII